MTTSKIVISKEADQSLDEMLAVVNDGFSSGRVKKNEIASWIVLHFYKNAFSKQIEAIRSDHFSAVAHLEGILKKLKSGETNDLAEINSLLAPVLQRKKSQAKESNKKENNIEPETE